MSVKNELEKKIEREKQKIVELRNQLEKAESFVAGMQEALRFMPKEGVAEIKAEYKMRPGSDMSKARDYLKKVGKPMYINEILKAIGKDQTQANRSSIGGSLDNYARRSEVFTKVAPRTYGLIEFGKTPANEPPPNFGVSDADTGQKDDDTVF